MRMRSLLATATVAVAAVVGASPADAAVTAQVAETGWWSQRPGATEQEGDGVEVAAALGAEQSVAALRIVISGGEATTATLTLEETGGVGQQAAVLTMCPTTDQWQAANPGAYAEAPEPDCSASAALTRADDGATWTADIGILLSGAETSLMIVPATEGPSALPVGPGYQVTFGEATVEADGGEPGAGGLAPPVPESGGPSDLGDTDPAGAGDDSGSSPETSPSPSTGFDAPSGGDPSLDTSTPPPVPPGDAAAATGAVELDSDASGSGAGTADTELSSDAFAAGPVASDGGDSAKWGRLVFLLPLCAIGGAAVAYGRPWLRERGLGRFLPD